MRTIVRFFIRYRKLTDDQIVENIYLKKKVLLLENAVSQKSPVNEAEYAFDDNTPFSLYDCVIPKLKEHRALKFDPRTELVQVYNDNIAKATAF